MKTNPLDIYAIKRSEGFFWTEKPVISTKISEITYDLENMEKSADPVEMNTATLENYSHIKIYLIKQSILPQVLEIDLVLG